jgi:hypothetical protein
MLVACQEWYVLQRGMSVGRSCAEPYLERSEASLRSISRVRSHSI